MTTIEKVKALFEDSLTKMSQMEEPPRNTWTYNDPDVEADFLIFCRGMDAGVDWVSGKEAK